MTTRTRILCAIGLFLMPIHADAGGTPSVPPEAVAPLDAHPLLVNDKPLAWSRLTPDQIRTDIDFAIVQCMAHIRAVENVAEPTYENTFGLLLDDSLLTNAFYRQVLLADMCDSPERRALSAELYKKYNLCTSALFGNEKIWNILKQTATPTWLEQLPPHRKRAVTELMAQFRDNGAGLPPNQKTQFAAGEQELTALSLQFSSNLTDSRTAWKLDITDFPTDDHIDPQDIEQANGRRYIRYRTALRLLYHSPDEQLRQTVWQSLQAIGREPRDNGPVINRILALRQQQARLLGYANHADRVAARCMMKTGAEAARYVRGMLARLQSPYREAMESLRLIKAELTGDPRAILAPWDVLHYMTIHVSRQSSSDISGLSRHFPSSHAFREMFGIFSQLYGIRIHERPTIHIQPGSGQLAPAEMVEVWHPCVRYFEIRNTADGRLLGSVYLDCGARPEKIQGAWAKPVTAHRRNSSDPYSMLISIQGETSETLHPGDASTLFHEFGHALHLILNEAEPDNLDFAAVPTDFLEFPSIFHEKLSREYEIVSRLSTPPLPKDTYDRYRNTAAIYNLFDIVEAHYLALFDLEIHMRDSGAENRDIDETEHDILQDYLYAFSEPTTHFSSTTSFPRQNLHIFNGRYAGLYYSYCWSSLLASDTLSRFREKGLLNPETGAEYRRTILSKGNLKPSAELYRDFMGRDPDPEAYLKELILIPAAPSKPETPRTTPPSPTP